MSETPDRDARVQARWNIIQAANRHKLRVRPQPRLFGMRQLQQSPHTLDLAGFRPVR